MPTPEISVQLYSIHAALDADLDGSLGKIADIGLRTVEAFDFVRRADALKESFDRYGLSSPTAHAILIEDEGVATPPVCCRCRRPRRPSPPPSPSASRPSSTPSSPPTAGPRWRTGSATPTG